MTSSELGGPAYAASRWAAWGTSPRVLIAVAAALLLTNVPFTGYWFWSSLGVLLALWRIWRHQRLIWGLSIAVTAANLAFLGLSIAGVINDGLPGWWIPVVSAGDFLALAILLSPPIRRWVAQQPAPSDSGQS